MNVKKYQDRTNYVLEKQRLMKDVEKGYLSKEQAKQYLDEYCVSQHIEPPVRANCPYRHENGNCLPVGGFCTSVTDRYCIWIPNLADSEGTVCDW